MGKRFGRMLGRAWWSGTHWLPMRAWLALARADRALEVIPGFLEGVSAAHMRYIRRGYE